MIASTKDYQQRLILKVKKTPKVQKAMADETTHPLPSFPFEGPYPVISKITLEELQAECEVWRTLWTWTPAAVKNALDQIGKTCRVVLRTNTGYIGEMRMGEFEQKSIEIRVIHREYNAIEGKPYIEYKTLIVPLTGIGHFEIIHESIEEVKDDEIADGPLSEMTYEDVVPE